MSFFTILLFSFDDEKVGIRLCARAELSATIEGQLIS
jgi:hypothetical protein